MTTFHVLLLIVFCLVIEYSDAANKTFTLKPGREPFITRIIRTRSLGSSNMFSLRLSRTESVTLSLQSNKDLLSSDYQEVSVIGKKTSVLREAKSIPVCWYKGQIVGDVRSRVLAADCEGFSGSIQKGNGQVYRVVPNNEMDVAVFPAEDEVLPPTGKCDVQDPVQSVQTEYYSAKEFPVSRPSSRKLRASTQEEEVEESENERQEKEEGHQEYDEDTHSFDHGTHSHSHAKQDRKLLQFDAETNIVEVAVVSDYQYLLYAGGAFGRDLVSVAERNIEILNAVQATYDAVPFSKPTTVRLKAQYFFSQGDPYDIPVVGGGVNNSLLLSRLADWSSLLPSSFDVVHLLTGYQFNSGAVGLAYVSGACNISRRVGISIGVFPVPSVVITVAHEIGHNLGMRHDGDGNSCPASGFLMGLNSTSCPKTGLCPLSDCSITSKNAFTLPTSCLNTYQADTCADGLQNGQETGIDCGGSCLPCPSQNGCNVNNGGCADLCIQLNNSFVCGCSDANQYLASDGLSCIMDVNQCLTSVCEENCTNLIGPGDSFFCDCSPPRFLSVQDGRSCSQPSCFDQIKNQDEELVDCGGVCARKCNCLISSTTVQLSYDGRFPMDGAQWRSEPSDINKYVVLKSGVPGRFLYRFGKYWQYDRNEETNFYLGVRNGNELDPSSSIWSLFEVPNRWIDDVNITFKKCNEVPSTCGNAKLEGPEMCESCLLYSEEQQKCLRLNPCCDSTCSAPSLRGTVCSVSGMAGSCWDGVCVNRNASCDLVTSLSCTARTCAIGAGGGQECGLSEEGPFDASTCSANLFCYRNCLRSTLLTPVRLGVTRGFPCSTPKDGVYPSVCDGGLNGTGYLSKCVTVASLAPKETALKPTRKLTSLPTKRPTRGPTLRPTRKPTRSPTRRPTKRPTSAPTRRPTRFPTNKPTRKPSTAKPTRVPSRLPTKRPTRAPVALPTARLPPTSLSVAPTIQPTSPATEGPTSGNPTLVPTSSPTSAPTSSPTLFPTLASLVTSSPTSFPTLSPTL